MFDWVIYENIEIFKVRLLQIIEIVETRGVFCFTYYLLVKEIYYIFLIRRYGPPYWPVSRWSLDLVKLIEMSVYFK